MTKFSDLIKDVTIAKNSQCPIDNYYSTESLSGTVLHYMMMKVSGWILLGLLWPVQKIYDFTNDRVQTVIALFATSILLFAFLVAAGIFIMDAIYDYLILPITKVLPSYWNSDEEEESIKEKME